jgi:hypothetical protein
LRGLGALTLAKRRLCPAHGGFGRLVSTAGTHQRKVVNGEAREGEACQEDDLEVKPTPTGKVEPARPRKSPRKSSCV